MQRLKTSLEKLDETITALEDKLASDSEQRAETVKKQVESIKQSRAREANALAVAQKVATRLDQAIDHVERILR